MLSARRVVCSFCARTIQYPGQHVCLHCYAGVNLASLKPYFENEKDLTPDQRADHHEMNHMHCRHPTHWTSREVCTYTGAADTTSAEASNVMSPAYLAKAPPSPAAPIEASPALVADATAEAELPRDMYDLDLAWINERGSSDVIMPPEPDCNHDGPNPHPCIANPKANPRQMQQLYNRAEENQKKGWANHRLRYDSHLFYCRSCRQANICRQLRLWYKSSSQEETYESLGAFDDLLLPEDQKVNNFADQQRKRLAKFGKKGGCLPRGRPAKRTRTLEH